MRPFFPAFPPDTTQKYKPNPQNPQKINITLLIDQMKMNEKIMIQGKK